MGNVTKSKLRIRVGHTGLVLMSRKHAPGTSKHDRLELIGGGLDWPESPREALLRELGEEELSGDLRAMASDPTRLLGPHRVVLDHGYHYLYELRLAPEHVSRLVPNDEESVGYVAVPAGILEPGNGFFITQKTERLLAAMGAQGVRWVL